MEINLPPEAAAIIKRKEAAKLAKLRQAIQEGLDSGPPVPGEEVFARLRAKSAEARRNQVLTPGVDE